LLPLRVSRRVALPSVGPYYGAFHVARLLIIEDCGVVLSGGPEIHRKLLFCLEESKTAQLVEIGAQLNSLREERNRADYNLKDWRFANPGNVQSQLAVAEEIVRSLRAAKADIAVFRPIVREYAKTVLRLGVRGE
jgi:hypothetical protein